MVQVVLDVDNNFSLENLLNFFLEDTRFCNKRTVYSDELGDGGPYIDFKIGNKEETIIFNFLNEFNKLNIAWGWPLFDNGGNILKRDSGNSELSLLLKEIINEKIEQFNQITN